jgi:hypothetical protein
MPASLARWAMRLPTALAMVTLSPPEPVSNDEAEANVRPSVSSISWA